MFEIGIWPGERRNCTQRGKSELRWCDQYQQSMIIVKVCAVHSLKRVAEVKAFDVVPNHLERLELDISRDGVLLSVACGA